MLREIETTLYRLQCCQIVVKSWLCAWLIVAPEIHRIFQRMMVAKCMHVRYTAVLQNYQLFVLQYHCVMCTLGAYCY